MFTRPLLGLAALPLIMALSGRASAQDVDPDPRLSYTYDNGMRFGINVIKDAAGKPLNKELTYSRNGDTNNTVAMIDKKEHQLHIDPAKWTEKNAKAGAVS